MFFVCCFLPISVLLPVMIMPNAYPSPFQFRQKHSLLSKIISGRSSFQILRRDSSTLLWDTSVPVSEVKIILDFKINVYTLLIVS